MNKKVLTATEAIRISKQKNRIKHMTGTEYKTYIRTLMDTYGLEKNDAFLLAKGEKTLELVAKYEKMER